MPYNYFIGVEESLSDFVSGRKQPLFVALVDGTLAENFGPAAIAFATSMRRQWIEDSASTPTVEWLSASVGMETEDGHTLVQQFIAAGLLQPPYPKVPLADIREAVESLYIWHGQDAVMQELGFSNVE